MIIKQRVMNRPMQVLEQAAKKKLRELDLDSPDPKSYLADLLMGIYGSEVTDYLNLPMADKQDLEDKIVDMMWLYPEGIQERFLDEEFLDLSLALILQDRLSTAKTMKEIQEVLILDLMYPAMGYNLDSFPSRGPSMI